MTTKYRTLTDRELINDVDNDPDASDKERELVRRLEAALKENPTDLTDKIRELADLLDERYGDNS